MKLATLKQQRFLYPFSVKHNWRCQKRMKGKGNGNFKINVKTNVKTSDPHLKVGKRLAFENACVGVVVAFDFAVDVELHPLLRRQ